MMMKLFAFVLLLVADMVVAATKPHVLFVSEGVKECECVKE